MPPKSALAQNILTNGLVVMGIGVTLSGFDLIPAIDSAYIAWFRSIVLLCLACLLLWRRLVEVRNYPHASAVGRLFHLVGGVLFGLSCLILSIYSLRASFFHSHTPPIVLQMLIVFFFVGMSMSIIALLLLPELRTIPAPAYTTHGWPQTIVAALISFLILILVLSLWAVFFA